LFKITSRKTNKCTITAKSEIAKKKQHIYSGCCIRDY